MKISVYLPDDLGEKAKKAEINLSNLLRNAVETELERLKRIASLTKESEEIELELENDNGDLYIGHFTGSLVLEDERVSVYLKDDEQILVHDLDKHSIHYIDDPEELSQWLDTDAYMEALFALGEKPRVAL